MWIVNVWNVVNLSESFLWIYLKLIPLSKYDCYRLPPLNCSISVANSLFFSVLRWPPREPLGAESALLWGEDLIHEPASSAGNTWLAVFHHSLYSQSFRVLKEEGFAIAVNRLLVEFDDVIWVFSSVIHYWELVINDPSLKVKYIYKWEQKKKKEQWKI